MDSTYHICNISEQLENVAHFINLKKIESLNVTSFSQQSKAVRIAFSF